MRTDVVIQVQDRGNIEQNNCRNFARACKIQRNIAKYPEHRFATTNNQALFDCAIDSKPRQRDPNPVFSKQISTYSISA
jgi:hypothetical protein